MNYRDRRRFSDLIKAVSAELREVSKHFAVFNERLRLLEEKAGIEDGANAAIERLKAQAEDTQANEEETEKE
jgi:hypothetical protein